MTNVVLSAGTKNCANSLFPKVQVLRKLTPNWRTLNFAGTPKSIANGRWNSSVKTRPRIQTLVTRVRHKSAVLLARFGCFLKPLFGLKPDEVINDFCGNLIEFKKDDLLIRQLPNFVRMTKSSLVKVNHGLVQNRSHNQDLVNPQVMTQTPPMKNKIVQMMHIGAVNQPSTEDDKNYGKQTNCDIFV